MAAASWRVLLGSRVTRVLNTALGQSWGRGALSQRVPLVGGILLGAGVTWYSLARSGRWESPVGISVVWAQDEVEAVPDEMIEKQSVRKYRFMQFASLEYEGELYMTPNDFLLSVMFEHLPRQFPAKNLTKKDVDAMLGKAAKSKPGTCFFRELGDKGMISYTEYMFLLTILTKPQTGFNIAFKMLDTDENEQVEKKEFFKLQRILGHRDEVKSSVGPLTTVQDIGSHSPDINTTLLVHFFGRSGGEKLQFSEFERETTSADGLRTGPSTPIRCQRYGVVELSRFSGGCRARFVRCNRGDSNVMYAGCKNVWCFCRAIWCSMDQKGTYASTV